MNRSIILIGIGGLLGSIARYLLASFFTKLFPSAFPYGTFIVNIVGCLLIGIFYGLSERYNWFTPDLRLFLATGFCGGFTTFSSLTFENLVLLQSSEYLTFALYSIGSFAVGLLAAFGGLSLTKI
ncbi:MAG: fluoride efflux transporter CrcB [Chitinophagaceae bacterium]